MSSFRFKKFEVFQDKCAMKIGTDGVLLGAWAKIAQASNILDIGTGTGVLALMAAQRNPTTSIHAVEIETEAAQQAQENFNNSPWRDRLHVFHSSIQAFQPKECYDVIISNPPYFEINKSTAIATKDRALARTTHALSFEALITAVQRLLSPLGHFSLILPLKEGEHFLHLAQNKGLYLNKIIKVIPRTSKAPNRLLLEFSKQSPTMTQNGTLTLRNAGNTYHDYTPEFIALHQDFLLIL
jgi:tRNA1Val (adenine37-N6)-methyltransferase